MKKFFKLMAMAFVASTLLVACGDKEEEENNNGTEQATTYTITVKSNNNSMGTVIKTPDSAAYHAGTEVILTATPKDGYAFANWSDGVDANPRTITVSKDETFTANFVEANTDHADVAYANTTWSATFVGCGTYEGDFITRLYKDKNASDQPSVYMVGGTSVGTYVAAQDNDYLWFYFNYEEDLTPYQGSYIPTWQCEEMTEVITAIDMNAQTFTYTATGSVWNAAEYLAGSENPTVNTLSTDVSGAWETIEFSKGKVMPKKLVRK